MKPARTRLLGTTLWVFLVWRAAAMGMHVAGEFSNANRSALVAALSDPEEERIRKSLAVYDKSAGEPLELYRLYSAIRENSERDAPIFVVTGRDEEIVRALTGMTGFLYPRRLHIARRLPGHEERGDRPDLLVLTLRGPYRDSPVGYKEPVASSAAWTLWK